MRDDLVSTGAVVLEHVVLDSASGLDELLRDRLRAIGSVSSTSQDQETCHTRISLKSSSGMSLSFSP